MQELGARLREQRESLGLTLADVEIGTRIRQKYLAALEADEWHLLPGEVVGRGFLRNYAGFIGLDVDEVIGRRRQVADPYLAQALASTSAGAPMPDSREVDYRPKDVTLVREPFFNFEEFSFNPRRFTPYVLLLLLLILLVIGGWWAVQQLAPGLSAMASGAQTRVAQLRNGAAPTAAHTVAAVAMVTESIAGSGSASGASTNPTEPATVAPLPTATAAPTDTPPPPTETPTLAVAAEAPPATEPATAEPTPTLTEAPPPEAPTPVPTPEPPAAPPVAAPACADARSQLTAPGVGQLVSGPVDIVGTARHENFWYYKLEFAPGADAAGGYVYFAGAENQINGALLGQLNSRALTNGAYTIRITVVDQTGNFPPPCQVSVIVQN